VAVTVETAVSFFFKYKTLTTETSAGLDGGGTWAQAWWEAPCADRI